MISFLSHYLSLPLFLSLYFYFYLSISFSLSKKNSTTTPRNMTSANLYADVDTSQWEKLLLSPRPPLPFLFRVFYLFHIATTSIRDYPGQNRVSTKKTFNQPGSKSVKKKIKRYLTFRFNKC